MEWQLPKKSDDNNLRGFQQQYYKKLELNNQTAEQQNSKDHDDTFLLTFPPRVNNEEKAEHESGVESDNDIGTDEESWDDDTILSIINGSNRPIKEKIPLATTTTPLCLSFSKLNFTRRFQPLWQENATFIEPAYLPMTMTSANLQQLPSGWDFDIWHRYSQSVDPARRESAANMLSIVVKFIENTCEYEWSTFFKQLENFMTDEKADIIRVVYKQIPEIANFIKMSIHTNRYKEFNKRIPGQLITMLVGRGECQKSALVTIQQLVDQKLLKLTVIKNIIIPGLIFYLNDAADKVYRFERIMKQRLGAEQPQNSRILYSNEDNSQIETISERDCIDNEGIIVGIFAIFSTIFSHISATEATEEFLAQFIEYVVDPIHIPILKSQDSSPIREILAGCLAPLAKIIGTNRADAKLLPIFQRFMREKPEVQCAALKQLADFISILSKKNQELLLPELSQLVTLDGDSRSWRQRAEFAEQLIRMVDLFSISLINTYICPFALAFSADRIAEVRNNGIGMLSRVLATFIKVEWGGEMLLTKQLLVEIRTGFLNTRDWRRKQSFGRLIYLLLIRNLLDEEQFCHFFTEDVNALSNDPIANVRQYFCLLAQLNQFPNRPIGKTMRIRLEQMVVDDPDMEIRNLAKIALGIVDPEQMGLDLTGREERLA